MVADYRLDDDCGSGRGLVVIPMPLGLLQAGEIAQP